ncbi:DUF6767 domain-containing protein [Micromonospora sp. NPDC005299]|uniref:DUF6767 domain-containing protein n=1 Tax=Micromonospora sp. NPDC005299 TaxID=3364231 RepID=UPI003689E660
MSTATRAARPAATCPIRPGEPCTLCQLDVTGPQDCPFNAGEQPDGVGARIAEIHAFAPSSSPSRQPPEPTRASPAAPWRR